MVLTKRIPESKLVEIEGGRQGIMLPYPEILSFRYTVVEIQFGHI